MRLHFHGIMSLTEFRPWNGRDGALRRLRAVVGAERMSKGVKFSTFVAPLLRDAGQRSALSLPPTSINDIISRSLISLLATAPRRVSCAPHFFQTKIMARTERTHIRNREDLSEMPE